MSGEILTTLFDQLFLIEGLLLGVTFGVLLLRHRYMLNCRRRKASGERGLEAPPAPETRALGSSPELARRLYRVR